MKTETAPEEFERFLLQALEKAITVAVSDRYMTSETAEDICVRNSLLCDYWSASKVFEFKKQKPLFGASSSMYRVKIHAFKNPHPSH